MGDKTLKAGTDYRIWYSPNGVSSYTTTAPTNAGTYYLKIDGLGNYTGTYSGTQRTFTIKPASIKDATLSIKTSVSYTGRAITVSDLNLQVKLGSKILPASNYTVSYEYYEDVCACPSAVTRGKYYVVVTPKGNNFRATSKIPDLYKAFTMP